MRGKVLETKEALKQRRITPAYAGKSFTQLESISREEDHPRLCGEKMPRERSGQLHQGSPPPMRGKVFLSFTSCTERRITPAYAGKREEMQLHRQ